MSKYIELAKKLKALADRGIGGEKYNAERKLKELMRKHHLTMEDVEGEKENYYEIKNITSEKRLLFTQVCYHVLGKKYRERGQKRDKNIIYVLCTLAEGMEVEAKFNFFWKLYKDELSVFYEAFISKNDIYATDVKSKNESDLSEEEFTKHMRVAAMASSIKKGQFQKQLKHGN